MKECWPEGSLRAYHDGELLPVDMERVAAHLAECPKCEALADEVAGRAARVAKLMSALPEPQQVLWMPRVTAQPASAWPRWTAVAVALAAGLAIAVWLTPRRAVPEPVVVSQPLERMATIEAPVRPAAVIPRPTATSRVATSRVATSRVATVHPAPKRQPKDVFFALDDEPIETGVLMRVALGEAEIPAEVVFGKDGRPRAIRLVSNQSNR